MSRKQYKIKFKNSLDKLHGRIARAMYFGECNNFSELSSEIPLDTTRKAFIPDAFQASASLNSHINSCKQFADKLFLSRSISRNRIDNRIFDILSKLSSTKSIVIKPADKNLGLTIMDRLFYKNMVLTHLSDTTTYEPSDRESAFNISHKLVNILKARGRYYESGSGNKFLCKLAKSLTQYVDYEACRIAPIYCLPKIHKNKTNPPGRPIVSSCSTLTYPASVYVDRCLRPYITTYSHICTSSIQVLNLLSNVILDSDEVFLCADITSLYPSIPIDFGIQVVSGFCANIFDNEQLSFVLELMRWVLENNYIIFNNCVYRQIKGTAMGTPMAPTFAIIFLTALELPLLYTLKHRVYLRYIDDIFAVMTKEVATSFVTAFNNLCPSIKLEAVTISTTGIFLDLQMDIVDSRVIFRTYQKPGNIYQYIPPFSNHPRAVFNAWVKEEIIRYRLKCSFYSDFIELCSKFTDRLLARGYSTQYVARAMASLPPRATLIERVNPNSSLSNPNNPPLPHRERFPIELVLALPNAPLYPKPRWREILAIPQSVTDHPEYRRVFGNKNIIITDSYPRSISSYLLRSLYTDT
jgi:hypothetical protein